MAKSQWQSRTIGRLHNNISEAEGARIGSEECIYWKTIVVDVDLLYNFVRFTVFTDSKIIKVTISSRKFYTDVKLPRRDIAIVRLGLQFEEIKFYFILT